MATRTSKVYLNLKATHFSGGSRPSHPDADIREGGGLQKIFFPFGLKIRGRGGRVPRAPPLDPPPALHFENDENRPVAPTRLKRL